MKYRNRIRSKILMAILLGVGLPPLRPWLAFASSIDEDRRAKNNAGEVLYNGIQLPTNWPPRLLEPTQPNVPPYLKSPPAVILIDVGRQLFVDDFLVETSTLKRTYHRPEYYSGNPVMRPERAWERTGKGPMAITHSGGVCFDPQDQLFKMWYMAGYQQGTALALSKDGIHWNRPAFNHVQAGTNLVYDNRSRGSTVWHNPQSSDPAKRFIMYSSRLGVVFFSKDGIHWGPPEEVGGPLHDRTTLHWNPFRQVWVYSIKAIFNGGRSRRYWETYQLVGGPRSRWQQKEEPTYWINTDSADPRRKDLQTAPQLYNLDVVAYESLLLGSFIIWRGDYRFDAKTEQAVRFNKLGRPKQNSACIGFSRDGFHWYRPDRRPFLPKSETPGDWNWGNSQTAGKSPLVVGDRLYFYVTGRAGLSFPGNTYQDAGGSTGLAFLRRDGFASMGAGRESGTLTTRPLRFSGKHLFVNVVNPQGELRIEILDQDGQVITPFTRAKCVPIKTNNTRQPVHWAAGDDLSGLAGKVVKFRFWLSSGELYAFWVSLNGTGASNGYVGGGGPGLASDRDTPNRITNTQKR